MIDAVFSIKQTVYIEDVDSYGIVYQANYLKYFERARTEWLKKQGLTLSECQQQDCLFAVKSITVNFRKPLRLQDDFIITATPTITRPMEIVFTQEIYQIDNLEKCLCNADVSLVTINNKSKVIPIPNLIKEKI